MPQGWLGWDWGTVPAWVGSVLTGGSVAFASFSYFRSIGDRHEERLERERVQVSQVSTWVGPSLGGDDDVLIGNKSDAAVDVVAFYHENGQRFASPNIGLGPGQIRGGRRISLLFNDRIPNLVITDSAGLVWLRTADSQLERLNQDELDQLRRTMTPHKILEHWEVCE